MNNNFNPLHSMIEKLLGLDDGKKYHPKPQRSSKHTRKFGYKATKAYADDRQKLVGNRRKYGRRKQKQAKTNTMNISVDTSKMTQVAENLLVTTTEDNKLVVVIDLETTGGLSPTGKMRVIANSGGFTTLPVSTKRKKPVKANIYIGDKEN